MTPRARCLHCDSKALRINDYALEEIQIDSQKPKICKMIIYICNECEKKSIW